MARWLVKLEADSFDLDEFPHWFPSGPIFATADASGTYLSGELIEVCSNPEDVHQIATATLDEMYAVICLLDSSVKRPTAGAVLREDDTGKRTGVVYVTGTIVGRSKVRGVLSVAGAENTPSTDTQAQLLLKSAQASRHLRIALSLLAMPHVSWPHLYRAIEEIETFLDSKVDEVGICKKNERDCFTRSANSGEVAGNEARHRIGRFVPPTQPMTLHEAKAFVRRCLGAALRNSGSVEN